MTTRRQFLAATALPLIAHAQSTQPKRIAAVVTEYRDNSHADVIVGKYLEGFRQNGQAPEPRSKVVSLYTAQVPKNDMSRDKAKKHNVPIYPTIWETLTLGGERRPSARFVGFLGQNRGVGGRNRRAGSRSSARLHLQ